jgi:hypothetical protein
VWYFPHQSQFQIHVSDQKEQESIKESKMSANQSAIGFQW